MKSFIGDKRQGEKWSWHFIRRLFSSPHPLMKCEGNALMASLVIRNFSLIPDWARRRKRGRREIWKLTLTSSHRYLHLGAVSASLARCVPIRHKYFVVNHAGQDHAKHSLLCFQLHLEISLSLVMMIMISLSWSWCPPLPVFSRHGLLNGKEGQQHLYLQAFNLHFISIIRLQWMGMIFLA